MSCNIQVVSATDGGLELTTAFVAGVSAPGGKRHDLDVIGLIGDRFGKDLRGKTPAQIISSPLMVDRSIMLNGAASAAEWYDDALGGTFFRRKSSAKKLRGIFQRMQAKGSKIRIVTTDYNQ
jgi:hypothetical protein